MVKMAWLRLLVSFMLVDAVVLRSFPCSISLMMSLYSITKCRDRSFGYCNLDSALHM